MRQAALPGRYVFREKVGDDGLEERLNRQSGVTITRRGSFELGIGWGMMMDRKSISSKISFSLYRT